jgi:hypothetical protein
VATSLINKEKFSFLFCLKSSRCYNERGGEKMSEEKTYGGEPGTEGTAPERSFAKKIHTEEAILLTLMALSAIGIGVTNFMPIRSFWYWVAMVPIFGGVSIYMGWSKARRRGEGASRIIRVQLLHWIGLLAAVVLIYLLYEPAGRINNNQLAFISLLALALATFLAGVHFDWRFMIIGIVLGACVAGAAFVEQFIWIIAIPIVVVLVLLIFWWKRAI